MSYEGYKHVIGAIQKSIDNAAGFPLTTRAELASAYWTNHPRFQVLKHSILNGTVLDLGAGPGGMINWRNYLFPKREDLSIYAIDIKQHENYQHYQGYRICNINEEVELFPGVSFDTVICSHVIEHLADPAHFFQLLNGALVAGGVAYVEMPTPHTTKLPTKELLRDGGYPESTFNFYDDPTHVRTYSRDDLFAMAEGAGFEVTEYGVIKDRFLEDALLRYGASCNDKPLFTNGLWSKFSWSQYLMVVKR